MPWNKKRLIFFVKKKNSKEEIKFVFDSGNILNLIEIFFEFYSSFFFLYIFNT